MKKILSILSIPLTIIFIIFIIYAFILGQSKTGDNYSKELMNKYKDKEIRINYFKENESHFNTISTMFKKYEEVTSIINKDIYELCDSKEQEITLNESISLCLKNDIKEELDLNGITQAITSLKDIVKITKNMTINTSNIEVEESVTFYLVTSTNHQIYYEYCLNNVECNTTEDYYEKDNKIYQKNKIDDYWSSIYDDIA